jgi:hypothetical protein
MSRSDDADDTVRKRSGWLIPLGVLAVISVLSILILAYYLIPSAPPLFTEQVSPTSSTDPVAIEIGGVKLWVPENYLQYDSARRGGHRREVALWSILPDLSGWSNWNSGSFSDTGPNSRIVIITIRDQQVNVSEADRLKRIYMAYVVDPKGTPGPFGLRQYTFSRDSGYRAEDLLVGDTPKGPMVLRCVRLGPDVTNPSCLRDMLIGKNVGLSYRFKRSKLSHWREIGEAVDGLVATFKTPPK